LIADPAAAARTRALLRSPGRVGLKLFRQTRLLKNGLCRVSALDVVIDREIRVGLGAVPDFVIPLPGRTYSHPASARSFFSSRV
jgi:hypothetical protein